MVKDIHPGVKMRLIELGNEFKHHESRHASESTLDVLRARKRATA